MQETWVRSLGREFPLEKEMATHSSTLTWKIPWTEEPGRLQSVGLQRVGYDWVTSLHFIKGAAIYKGISYPCCCSVAKSRVTLRPHGLKHSRLLCPPLLSEFVQTHVHWVDDAHPTISSSVVPFSSCPQSFPASGSFPMSWLFASGWPKYWSFSFSISPSNEYSELISFRIDWLDLLAVQGTSGVFSSTTVRKHQFFSTQPSLWSNSHIHTWLLGKP